MEQGVGHKLALTFPVSSTAAEALPVTLSFPCEAHVHPVLFPGSVSLLPLPVHLLPTLQFAQQPQLSRAGHLPSLPNPSPLCIQGYGTLENFLKDLPALLCSPAPRGSFPGGSVIWTDTADSIWGHMKVDHTFI